MRPAIYDKRRKHTEHKDTRLGNQDRYFLTPIGFETLGSWGTDASAIVKEIGHKLAAQSGEQRAASFLIQKISIELQRRNACSILGTFPDVT